MFYDDNMKKCADLILKYYCRRHDIRIVCHLLPINTTHFIYEYINYAFINTYKLYKRV